MTIVVIGINHKTAPVGLRENIYFAMDKLALYLNDILTQGIVREAVLISTCNRSELYCETDDIEAVKEWFCAQTAVLREELLPALYVYRDQDAVSHLMEVACGSDSMVLGEPQILGQLKEAFAESCSAGAVSTVFHRLFQHVFAITKTIRTTTAIGACPVSVASAAVYFAKQQYPSLSQAKVVVIGAGDTTDILLRYLHSEVSHPITIVNRSVDKAKALANGQGCIAYGFDRLIPVLTDADIVFSATGSAKPLVDKTSVTKAMFSRLHRPLVFIDIAVPRDIDQRVADLPEVRLHCIDDLKIIIEKNQARARTCCRESA